jgi:hypothetical protein
VSNIVIPSYVSKKHRAARHLAEITELVSVYAASRPFRVGTGPADERGLCERYLEFTRQPGDEIAIAVGDFMHNVRSGLNHLAAACTDDEHQRSVQFPIFTTDPGLYQGPDTRNSWKRQTAGIAPAAYAAIDALQPFRSPQNQTIANGLTLVEDISNTDKHRELIILATALSEPIVTVVAPNGQRFPIHNEGAIAGGSRIGPDRFHPDIQLEIDGTPWVAVSLPDGGHADLMVALPTILSAFGEVIDALAPHTIR